MKRFIYTLIIIFVCIGNSAFCAHLGLATFDHMLLLTMLSIVAGEMADRFVEKTERRESTRGTK